MPALGMPKVQSEHLRSGAKVLDKGRLCVEDPVRQFEGGINLLVAPE